MENPNMALVRADQAQLAQYAIFDPNRDAVAALQRAVGNKLGPTDLVKITMGINGKWTVPSVTGKTEVDYVEGVVVYNHIWRGLYPKKFSKQEAGAVPQCTSNNGIHGVGDPGVECETCPFNAWGSAGAFYKDGSRGKACKEFWFIYLWRAGKRLPELLQIPATSLGYMRQYMMGLLDFAELDGLSTTEDGEEVPMPILGVITRFNLQEVKGNVKVAPQVAGILPEAVWPHMARASAFVGNMLATQSRVSEAPSRPQVVHVTPSGYDTAEDLIAAANDPAPTRATIQAMADRAAANQSQVVYDAPEETMRATPPARNMRPPARRVAPVPVPVPAEDDLEDIEI